MRMCFELIDSKDLKELKINNNSTIGDEFCGTFGFPLYLRKFLKKYKLNIKDKNVYGIEYEDRASRFCIINAMFSMSDFRNIDKGDSFRTNISPHLDISVHNVPFGKRMRANIIENEYNKYREDNKEKKLPYFDEIVDVKINKDCVLSSQLVIYKTKKMGLCIIKDGEETSGNGNYIKYRKFFCENSTIKKILKIPAGSFSSTGTKTVCIYFIKKKGYSTKNIQFLEIDNSFTKINEICNVSIDDLKHNNYSWNPDDYIIDEKISRLVSNSKCELKKIGDLFNFEKKSKRKASYGKSIGEYNYYTSSLNVNKFVDENDYDKPSIIIGDGGCANINYCDKFSVSDHCYVLNNNNEIITKYSYYYLRFNLDQLEKYFIGSGIRNISKTNLKRVMVPIPELKYQSKVIKILDDLMLQRELLSKRVNGIKNEIKYNFELELNTNKCNKMKLCELLKISIGSTPSTKKSVYWSNGKHLHISVSELNNKLDPITKSKKKLTDKALEDCKPKLVTKGTLLMSFKLSIGKLGFAGCDLYTNEAIVRIDTGKKFLNEWLFYYFLTFKPEGATGAIGNGNLNKQKLNNLEIKLLLNENDMKEIVKRLNKLQDRVKIYEEDIKNLDKLMTNVMNNSFLIEK
jgi:restriction endonuclease S subunit